MLWYKRAMIGWECCDGQESFSWWSDIKIKVLCCQILILQRDEAPGKDKITGGILLDSGETIITTPPTSSPTTNVYLKAMSWALERNHLFSYLTNTLHYLLSILLHPPAENASHSEPSPAKGAGGLPVRILYHRSPPDCQPALRKANEYNIPLCLAFVDYEKAFDSIMFTLCCSPRWRTKESILSTLGFFKISTTALQRCQSFPTTAPRSIWRGKETAYHHGCSQRVSRTPSWA